MFFWRDAETSMSLSDKHFQSFCPYSAHLVLPWKKQEQTRRTTKTLPYVYWPSITIFSRIASDEVWACFLSISDLFLLLTRAMTACWCGPTLLPFIVQKLLYWTCFSVQKDLPFISLWKRRLKSYICMYVSMHVYLYNNFSPHLSTEITGPETLESLTFSYKPLSYSAHCSMSISTTLVYSRNPCCCLFWTCCIFNFLHFLIWCAVMRGLVHHPKPIERKQQQQQQNLGSFYQSL